MKYEVVLTVFEPHKAIRMPALRTEEEARSLASKLDFFYPDVLIEIAHEGIKYGYRSGRRIRSPMEA